MSVLRRVARAVLGLVDAWYYRRYRLSALGPVLLLGHRDDAAKVAQLALDLASTHRAVALQSR